MNQKAATLRKVVSDHAEKPPKAAEFEELLPKPAKEPEAATVLSRAQEIEKSLVNIKARREKGGKAAAALWAQLAKNDKARELYDEAVAAIAKLVTALEGKPAKATKASKAAAAKAEREGASLN